MMFVLTPLQNEEYKMKEGADICKAHSSSQVGQPPQASKVRNLREPMKQDIFEVFPD